MREFLEADEKAFGQVLRLYRKSNNMTQKRVSEYLGIDRSTYAKYETMRKPEIDVILKLSALYNISLDDFMSSFFSEDELLRDAAENAPLSMPDEKEHIEVSSSEKRLILFYRNSIRKAEILKAVEEIFNMDKEIGKGKENK